MKILFILCFLCAGCTGTHECINFSEETAIHNIEAWGFSASIPSDMTARNASLVEDFVLIEIGAESIILKIYSGHNPSFSNYPGGKNSKLKFHGNFTNVSEIEQQGKYSKDMLISLEDNQFLHCYYDNLLVKEKEIAESIICSIKIKNIE